MSFNFFKITSILFSSKTSFLDFILSPSINIVTLSPGTIAAGFPPSLGFVTITCPFTILTFPSLTAIVSLAIGSFSISIFPHYVLYFPLGYFL